MATPIIMLLLLMLPWMVSRILRRSARARATAGAVGITCLLLFTGVGHFVSAEPMSQLIPPGIPGAMFLVYVGGIVEMLLAAAVLFPKARPVTGWIIIALLIALLPLNIYGAVQRVPFGGHAWGWPYLFIRVPLQGILIAWVYRFAVRDLPAAPLAKI